MFLEYSFCVVAGQIFGDDLVIRARLQAAHIGKQHVFVPVCSTCIITGLVRFFSPVLVGLVLGESIMV